MILFFVSGATSAQTIGPDTPQTQNLGARLLSPGQMQKKVEEIRFELKTSEEIEDTQESKENYGIKAAQLAGFEKYLKKKSISVNVPLWFGIPASTVRQSLRAKQFVKENQSQFDEKLDWLSRNDRSKFGSASNPMLVSVRASHRYVRPGRFLTILNVGINDRNLDALGGQLQDDTLARELYAKLIREFAVTLRNVPRHYFDRKNLLAFRPRQKHEAPDDWLVRASKEMYRREIGEDFPQDPYDQLDIAIRAVAFSTRAGHLDLSQERQVINGVIIQKMHFGNLPMSFAGSITSRDPGTGLPVDDNIGSAQREVQGDDAMDLRGFKDLASFYREITADLKKLAFEGEKYLRDIAILEFTIERDPVTKNVRPYLLQIRRGHFSLLGRVQMVHEMVKQGLITKYEALDRIEGLDLEKLKYQPTDEAKNELFKHQVYQSEGRAVSSGNAIGVAAFSEEKVLELRQKGIPSILVKPVIAATDEEAIRASAGIIAIEDFGWHAESLSLRYFVPAVVGLTGIQFDPTTNSFSFVGDLPSTGLTSTDEERLNPYFESLINYWENKKKIGEWHHAEASPLDEKDLGKLQNMVINRILFLYFRDVLQESGRMAASPQASINYILTHPEILPSNATNLVPMYHALEAYRKLLSQVFKIKEEETVIYISADGKVRFLDIPPKKLSNISLSERKEYLEEAVVNVLRWQIEEGGYAANYIAFGRGKVYDSDPTPSRVEVWAEYYENHRQFKKRDGIPWLIGVHDVEEGYKITPTTLEKRHITQKIVDIAVHEVLDRQGSLEDFTYFFWENYNKLDLIAAELEGFGNRSHHPLHQGDRRIEYTNLGNARKHYVQAIVDKAFNTFVRAVFHGVDRHKPGQHIFKEFIFDAIRPDFAAKFFKGVVKQGTEHGYSGDIRARTYQVARLFSFAVRVDPEFTLSVITPSKEHKTILNRNEQTYLVNDLYDFYFKSRMKDKLMDRDFASTEELYAVLEEAARQDQGFAEISENLRNALKGQRDNPDLPVKIEPRKKEKHPREPLPPLPVSPIAGTQTLTDHIALQSA